MSDETTASAHDTELAPLAASGQEGGGHGVHLTPRRTLGLVAAMLAASLIALLIFLLWLLSPDAAPLLDTDAVKGIQAERVITGPETGEQPQFSQPMGAAWSPDGSRVYVADSKNNRICIFESDGRFVGEFGGFGIAKPLEGARATWKPGNLNYPTDVATDDDGNVYVADFYNDSISVFTEEGEFRRRFPDPALQVGKGGSGQDGGGIAVTALTVDGDEVYATDGYQVVVFTRDGEFLRQFGRPGRAPGELDRPNGIVVTGDGLVAVSDSNNNRVTAYTREGAVQWTAGSKLSAELDAAGEKELVLPRGITETDEDTLLVADPLGQQLVELSMAGEILAAYGQRGTAPGELNFPNDVDHHDGRLLVADRQNDRVQIVRLVEQ